MGISQKELAQKQKRNQQENRERIALADERNEYRFRLIMDRLPVTVILHPTLGALELKAESKYDAFRRAAKAWGVGMEAVQGAEWLRKDEKNALDRSTRQSSVTQEDQEAGQVAETIGSGGGGQRDDAVAVVGDQCP